MNIEYVLLFRDGLQEPRAVPFEPARLNIITGASKTGKSAMLEIIEYCLGGGDFTVPYGVVRDKVSWYGIVIRDDKGRFFVGRPKPAIGAGTSTAVCLQLDPRNPYPLLSDLSANMNVGVLNELLTARLGIRENRFNPPAGQTRPPLEATIRHALKFCMQAQGEIANRDILFHRQVDPWISQALKDALPYLLGFVPDEQITITKELRALKIQERRLRSDQEVEDTFHDSGGAMAQVLIAEAVSCGLLPEAASTQQVDPVATLEQAVKTKEQERTTFADLDIGLRELRQRRIELSREYRAVRDTINDYYRFQHERDEYGGVLQDQASRLSAVLLVDGDNAQAPVCPLCEQRVNYDLPAVSGLRSQLEKLTRTSTTIAASQSKVSAMIDELQTRSESLRAQLRNNHLATVELSEQGDDLLLSGSLSIKQAEIRGRISLFLQSRKSSSLFPSILRQRLDEMQQRIVGLQARLDEFTDDSQEDSVSNFVAADMTHRAAMLNFEYKNDPLRLDLRRLLVYADKSSGTVAMPHMGSGENWLACHILVHLGLHSLFGFRQRPVPRFLVLDQPTQVYYPPESDEATKARRLDEDRLGVDRIFRLLHRSAEDLRLQIIVMDHADLDEAYFKSAIVERWRTGDALVPAEWPESPSPEP